MSKLQKIVRSVLVAALLAIVMGAVSAQSLLPNELPEGYLYTLNGNTAMVRSHIYVRDGQYWVHQTSLSMEHYFEFGNAIALQNDTAVVTVYGQDDHSPEPIPSIDGTLRIFKRTGTTWEEE